VTGAHHLLLGGSGVLGSGFRVAFARSGRDVARVAPRWGEPGHVAAVVEAALSRLGAPDREVTVIWAAGIGHTGAGESAMSAETAAVRSLCEVIAQSRSTRRQRTTVLFASSAGALYGGHGLSEIAEGDEPCPVTAYGREKLVQENLLRAFSEATGCRVVICRYSNLYGLADGRLTARGLVSTAVLAARLRQPMVVYVSPDTRRDLVYNRDAAAESLRLLESAAAGVTTALVHDGDTRTVSEILALVSRVSGRRVPATYADRPETRLQPKALRFRRRAGDSLGVRRTPIEVALHRMLRAPVAP
jgi:UDP-glucose 4-epimerase